MDARKIPDCSIDADEAGSSSQESDLMDCYDTTDYFNNASPEDYDIESASSGDNDVDSNHASSGEENENVEDNTDKVRQKLIETGQMQRLKDLMERRLCEIGWRVDMMARCRDIVLKNGANTTFEMLFQPLRQVGKDIIPGEIKEDVLQKIKYCFESETKEN